MSMFRQVLNTLNEFRRAHSRSHIRTCTCAHTPAQCGQHWHGCASAMLLICQITPLLRESYSLWCSSVVECRWASAGDGMVRRSGQRAGQADSDALDRWQPRAEALWFAQPSCACCTLSTSRDLWSSQQRHAAGASVSDRVHGSPRAASLRRFIRLISGTGGWARLSDYVDSHISWLCSCCWRPAQADRTDACVQACRSGSRSRRCSLS